MQTTIIPPPIQFPQRQPRAKPDDTLVLVVSVLSAACVVLVVAVLANIYRQPAQPVPTTPVAHAVASIKPAAKPSKPATAASPVLSASEQRELKQKEIISHLAVEHYAFNRGAPTYPRSRVMGAASTHDHMQAEIIRQESAGTQQTAIGAIYGTVVNRGEKTGMVFVEFNTYDSTGAKLNTHMANVANLEAGERWNFRIQTVGGSSCDFSRFIAFAPDDWKPNQ